MEFLKLMKERYSCRKLSDKPVEREKIVKILEAGISAPTAVNYQPYKIWVIESEEARRKLSEANRYVFGAELFFIVGADPKIAWTRKFDNHNFAEIDASIVATQMMLAITELGLGTTWVGHFDEPKLKELMPELRDYELIAIFPVGYPAEDAEPSERHFMRKSIEEQVKFL